MKNKNATRFHRIFSLVATLALIPFMGAATMVTTPSPSPSPNGVANSPKLSAAAHEVVKMATSGVPEDTIKAYVDGVQATFNLTPDNIINLQGVGVSSGVMTEMLKHDKELRDNANAYASAMTAQAQSSLPPGAYPPTTQAPPDNGYPNATPDDTNDYNQLVPYGNWNYLAGYGWCWQPYAGLAYNSYPWGLLDGGCWFNWPGRGWCWSPGSRFNRFDNRGFAFNRNRFGAFSGNRFGTFGVNRFGANRFNGNVGVRTIGVNHSFGATRSFGNRSFSGFRGFSPSMGHFSGGHFGGGSFGGGHASAGFGGGHGGGGHR